MVEKFKEFLFQDLGLQSNQRVLLAVSGGMDSMCMWELFRQCDVPFAIAHCNFKLRGQESDDDASFVSNHCLKSETAFFTSFNTEAYAKVKKISTQMAARELRYDYFEKIKKANGFDLVAVAHHLDDQVETYFIQLLRKSGLGAMSGMPQVTEKLIRPMMFTQRAQIQEYVLANKIPFREDSSNAKETYQRNFIRHQLIPQLKSDHPQLETDVLNWMNALKTADEVLTDYFNSADQRLKKTEDAQLAYAITDILGLPLPELFLEKLLQGLGFSKKLLPQLWAMIHSNESGKYLNGPKVQILKDRNHLRILSPKKEVQSSFELNKNDLITFKGLPVNAKVFEVGQTRGLIKGQKKLGQFDYDKLQEDVIFRKWKTGDFFYPLGLKGKKKLSDFFIDEKYSVEEKGNQWLFCSGNDICWVLGRRTDERFKIDEKTKNILEIEFQDE